MDKHSLDFLTNEWHNNAKDQVVINALYNLIGLEYRPIMRGITAYAISKSACDAFSGIGICKRPTNDTGTCSLLTQELMSILIESGRIDKDTIQKEVNRLFSSTYDADYEVAMGPF